MMTTLSAAMRRRWTSSAGNAWRLQNQRPDERVAEPSSSNSASSSLTSARPRCSSASNGSSNKPARRQRRRPALLEQRQQLLDVGATQVFLGLERQLEQAGLQVSRKQKEVV